MRRLHLVVFVMLISLGSASSHGAQPGSVSGVVCNSSGVPQMGALVELLRPDLTIVTSVYTGADGVFSIPSVVPGRYALKAMGTSFLPAMRENVRVRSNTVVNLTLNTLYEVMQWLPAEPRTPNAEKDDWAWTLRSAANRPLLRWLEDGPLVVVSDGSGAKPNLKARLVATGQQGTFGESGERISVQMEETPANSRELLASVDFDPGSAANMESMLGFRQDLGFAGSVQSVAAVAIHPEIESGEGEGLDEAAVRSWESMNFGDEFEAEAGSTQVLARLASNSPNTVMSALPFASVAWRNGNTAIRYRLATQMPATGGDESRAQTWMPAVSMRNGALAIEHGMHQEIGWERKTERSNMSVLVFADRVDNPAIEAMTGRGTGPGAGAWLYDAQSGLLHVSGPNYSSAGILAAVDTRLPGGDTLGLTYADGDALAMATAAHAAQISQIMAAVRTRRSQTYSISLSGTLEGTGTRWRASYRWQPEDTVTPVAPFAGNAVSPYMSVHLRQPIHVRRDGTASFEALLDMQNLLAQGYRPYLLSDGTVLMFAQDQRSISGGFAFTF